MKKLFIYGLAALLAAGVASCSKDEGEGGGKILEKDQSFFANIAINGTETMSRAGALGDYGTGEGEGYDPSKEPNFDPGTSEEGILDENKVTTIFLVFYDEDKNRVSTTQVRRSGNPGDLGNTNSENSLYSGVVQIDVKHGSKTPAYVMAFINPITATNFEINPDFATLEAVDETTRPRLIDDDGNFAMSKSSYYGKDRTKNSDELVRLTATPFLKGQLFNSYESAEAAMKAKDGESSVVEIYVERYAAKVSFTIDPNANKNVKVDEHTLVFVPEYWAVNAYEDKTYITKSFFSVTEDGELGGVMSYDQMNQALGGTNAWYWNSEENHRSYWAQSPAYYSEAYPRVADDIKDQMGFAAGGYSLGYYSYNEIVKNADEKATSKARNLNDAADKLRAIYARENTVSGKALKAAAEDPFASPKAAIASVVLVGHYTLDGATIGENNSFYVMGNATNGYMLFNGRDEMLNYFMRTTLRFALDGDGYDTFFDYSGGTFKDVSYKDLFVIEHPSLTVRGDQVVDSRFVTIQLDPAKLGNRRIWAMLDGEYQQVTMENINDINTQMFFAAGTVQGFRGGKVYYTIPIKHLGFYRNGNKNAGKNANDKNFDWQEVMSGDFGLVRNHSYKIIVDNITGLGNAIPDPEDPIVPPTDPEEYFIGARIIVLNWAVVPAQHVTL